MEQRRQRLEQPNRAAALRCGSPRRAAHRDKGLTATRDGGRGPDPALAMLLGLPVPRPNYEQQAAAEARQQQIERMQRETDATRQRNQPAAETRYKATLKPTITGGRRGT